MVELETQEMRVRPPLRNDSAVWLSAKIVPPPGASAMLWTPWSGLVVNVPARDSSAHPPSGGASVTQCRYASPPAPSRPNRAMACAVGPATNMSLDPTASPAAFASGPPGIAFMAGHGPNASSARQEANWIIPSAPRLKRVIVPLPAT
jgi:hypothetical protein